MKTMSDRTARFAAMKNHAIMQPPRCAECVALALTGELCQTHAERWASLEGLVSTLALPPARRKDGSAIPVGIEVDVGGDAFEQIETMALDSERIIITTYGGKRIERPLSEGVPAWRRL